MANLIPQIAKMLGVELGEKFKVDINNEIFQITESGIWMKKDVNKDEWVEMPFEFMMLCNGDAEIVKLPWKPKKGEKYWGFWYSSVNDAWLVLLYTWANNPADFALYKAGWVYRSKKEAEAALPAVAAEMGVEYVL